MAKKNELKGIVTAISAIATFAKNNTRNQCLDLHCPGYVDEYGDKKSRDEDWTIEIFNDRIEKANLQPTDIGRKAIVTVYIGSRATVINGIPRNIISATLSEIKFL